MSERLDLRYRTSAENDNDRANAIFSGAVLVYRSLPAMHDLVDCLREITQREVGLSDPCLAESILKSEEFRHRASSARQIVRENDDVARLYKKVLLEVGVDLSAVFYDHFKLRFQPSDDASKTRYMRDLPAHRDTWGSNIHAQINWWAPVWPVTADRTIGIFPALWNVPVPNVSAEWSYRELIQRLKGDKSTRYPMLPQCLDPPSPNEAEPIVIHPGDIMAFSGAHLHCSMPNQSGLVRVSTETRTVSAHDLLYSRSAKNVDCGASFSHFDWFHHIETGDSLAHHAPGGQTT
jgi:hypothetical protein